MKKFVLSWPVVALVVLMSTLITGVLLILVLKDKAPASILITPFAALVGGAVTGVLAYLKGLYEPSPQTIELPKYEPVKTDDGK